METFASVTEAASSPVSKMDSSTDSFADPEAQIVGDFKRADGRYYSAA